MNKPEIYNVLKQYWGYKEFRPIQESVINSVLENKDTLVLMPTGGGKSLTFQVPSMVREGTCIVVTPLIALMKDQVERLKSMKIAATAIFSGMEKDEIKSELNRCVFDQVKFLYCSPERLSTDLFRDRLQHMNISLIAIDEAHCISQWGYDFRPSYLQINEIRKIIPDTPILALTATATARVVDDIMAKLDFKKTNVIRTSFERKNLVYVVRKSSDKYKEILNICNKIKGTGIIYVRTRRKTKEIADFLKANNILAEFYHAGLDIDLRNSRQALWMSNKCRVIVCTNAFGMGIDKPDVRFVIHFELPESIEAYFQEAGRAGRDGLKAFAVIVYDGTDITVLKNKIVQKYPMVADIRDIYEALFNYFQIAIAEGRDECRDFNFVDFTTRFKLSPMLAYNSLQLLQHEGYLEISEDLDHPSRIQFLVARDDLYKFQISNERFDQFIKLLLRNYEGLFSQFTKISEDDLALKSGVKREIIFEYLIKLSQLKIIQYIPRKKTPVIFFAERRLERNSVIFSDEVYNRRKNDFLERIASFLQYVESETKCRSIMLLEYFGDHSAERCGHCDVCIKRNEVHLSKEEFDNVLTAIKAILLNEVIPYEALIDRMCSSKEAAIEVVRWLLDNHKIIQTNEGLSWSSK